MTFNIAFFADSHLGYRAKVRDDKNTGINQRVQDGYDALKEITRGIIESDTKIDAVVHGGDFAHTSQPSVRDVAVGNFYLRKIAEAGIPFYGLGGNHDTSDLKRELSAVAAFHDPERNIHMVWEPYKQFEIADGLLLHVMSHHGLNAKEAPELKVSNEYVNLFTTHGAAVDPKNKTLLRCIDSPREQIIPVELITEGLFNASLLGHYHNRFAVGGEQLNTWYAGSALRRGFSDEPGMRGWLLVKVSPDGSVEVEAQNISQRPQFDLPEIDATDLTPSDILSQLEQNLNSTQGLEAAPIVRQKVKNADAVVRETLKTNGKQIDSWSQHCLSFQLVVSKPEEAENKIDGLNISLKDRHSIDIVDNYKKFADAQIGSVPEEYREAVHDSARKHLEEARDIHELAGGHSH